MTLNQIRLCIHALEISFYTATPLKRKIFLLRYMYKPHGKTLKWDDIAVLMNYSKEYCQQIDGEMIQHVHKMIDFVSLYGDIRYRQQKKIKGR